MDSSFIHNAAQVSCRTNCLSSHHARDADITRQCSQPGASTYCGYFVVRYDVLKVKKGGLSFLVRNRGLATGGLKGIASLFFLAQKLQQNTQIPQRISNYNKFRDTSFVIFLIAPFQHSFS
jgi:hypothetical protein